jgi:prepilin-type N-terminal cleavage/methylation domain-containing protein
MNKNGFTLTEIMFALGIFVMVTAGTFAAYIACNKSWYRSDVQIRSMNQANMALEKITYGVSGTNGLRSAVGTTVVATVSGGDWTLIYGTPDGASYRYRYVAADGNIVYANCATGADVCVIASKLVSSSIATNKDDGLTLRVRAGVQDGVFAATNEATTYVHYRN